MLVRPREGPILGLDESRDGVTHGQLAGKRLTHRVRDVNTTDIRDVANPDRPTCQRAAGGGRSRVALAV